ncbi:MAG: hypothetical protein ACSHXB_10570 [Sulfitobacter sp.]
MADLIEVSRPAQAKSFDLGVKLGELSVHDKRSDYFARGKGRFARFVDDVELGFRQEFEQFLSEQPIECILAIGGKRFLIAFDTAFYHGFSVEAGSTWVKLKIALGITASLYGGIATYPSFEDGLARINSRIQTVVTQSVGQEYFMKIIKHDLQAQDLRNENPDLDTKAFWDEMDKLNRDFRSLLDIGQQQQQVEEFLACTWVPNDVDELRASVENYLKNVAR